jgi:glutamate-ammonia-ligase adenylyltransferase
MRASDLILSADLPDHEAHAFLKQYGFEDAAAADANLQKLAELTGVRERLAELLPALLRHVSRSPDPDLALGQLEVFLDSSSNPLAFLSHLEANPMALEVLVTILGSSPYLTQILRRTPEYFYWLMEKDQLDLVAAPDCFLRELKTLMKASDASPEQTLASVRRFRRRETLRIGAQDLLGRASLEASITQISDLADAVLDAVFRITSQCLDSPVPFAVLALGKLGGRELNFSSDVDLIYVHGDGADHSAMTRFGREYTRTLTQFTAEGHLYRVDLRLRPMGKTGEIVYPLEACLHYYQTWADTFDRLALMKCRCVAGDRDLGEAFVRSIQDFIFKKYLDTAAVEEIRWVKRQTDRRLRERAEIHRNIKLGEGGIREVEFFVQAFQLLYGGLHPEIRSPNTLAALNRLVDHGFILPKDYHALRRAYIHLRDLENKLQLVNDLQTHTLPESDQDLARCAKRMGYRGKPDDPARGTPLLWFRQELEAYSQSVRLAYDSLFAGNEANPGLEEIVLNRELSREEVLEKLRAAGVANPEEFYSGLQVLEEAPAYPHSPSRMRNLLANLLPRLVENSGFSQRPAVMLNRFDRLCEAVGSRASLYSELIENRAFGRTLFMLLAASDFLSETLIRNPELLDAVSQPQHLPFSAGELRRLEEAEKEAGRDTRNGLRIFKRREEFKIAVSDLLEPEQIETRRLLSELAEACLTRAVERAFDRMPTVRRQRFALLGLGKLGGRELTHHSDLDLVFVYDDRFQPVTALELNEFVKEFRNELDSYTEAGFAYKVDFRLRPEGKHGPLAVPLSIIRQYFLYRAEIWERLAWIKSRPVFEHGCSVPLAELVFTIPPLPTDLGKLAHIRARKELEIGHEDESDRFNFKVGRGGLLDVQFLVQYLELQNQIAEPNTMAALEMLVARGLLDGEPAGTLKRGLAFLFCVESAQRLLEETSANSFSKDPAECNVLARYTGFASGQELVDRYVEETESIRGIYEKVFGQGA